MRHFSTMLLGLPATAALVAAPFVSVAPVFAMTGPEINQIAQKTSVHILVSPDGENIAGTGSGFIVARNGDKYYVATNAHVTDGGRYFGIRLHDKDVVASETVTYFNGLDLAVVEFESSRDYPVATLAPTVEVGQDVFVSGWPPPHPGSNEIVRQFIYGRVSADLTQDFYGGYEISYSAPTDVGMSGGQVIDASGRVVAIHGMGGPMTRGAIAQRIGANDVNDPVVDTLAKATKSGLNYGIPISTFINQAAANGIYLNFEVSRDVAQPLGAPIADAKNADPVSSADRIEDVTTSLSAIVGMLDVLREGIGIVCGFLGC
jgi:S1-C subfamily serine protease